MAKLAVLLFVFTSIALGCSREQIDLTEADAGRTIAMGVGDAVDITLGTTGPGEYGTPEISSPAIRFVTVQEVGHTPAGPTQLFKFEAASGGQATIVIPHTRYPSFAIQANVSP